MAEPEKEEKEEAHENGVAPKAEPKSKIELSAAHPTRCLGVRRLDCGQRSVTQCAVHSVTGFTQ